MAQQGPTSSCLSVEPYWNKNNNPQLTSSILHVIKCVLRSFSHLFLPFILVVVSEWERNNCIYNSNNIKRGLHDIWIQQTYNKLFFFLLHVVQLCESDTGNLFAGLSLSREILRHHIRKRAKWSLLLLFPVTYMGCDFFSLNRTRLIRETWKWWVRLLVLNLLKARLKQM